MPEYISCVIENVKCRNNMAKLIVEVSRGVFFVIIANYKLIRPPGLTVFPLYLAKRFIFKL